MFDIFDKIFTSAVGALGFIAWIFPNINISSKIIVTLALLCIYLVVVCVRLFLKNKKLNDMMVKSKENHTALSNQFDEQQRRLVKYKSSFDSIGIAITVASYSSAKDKVSKLMEIFLRIEKELLGGKSDG